jgi:hypothetical protein
MICLTQFAQPPVVAGVARLRKNLLATSEVWRRRLLERPSQFAESLSPGETR